MPGIAAAESGYRNPVNRYHDGVLGRVRSRSRGEPRPGLPEVVLVHGMTACDYLLPSLAELAGWTRAHLIDLPGCGGSGDPPHELTVAEFAAAVHDWLDHAGPAGRVLLAGHSSGTQVAAEAARSRPGRVTGVVLGSPVFDPACRRLDQVLGRWLLDLSREPSGLEKVNRPERRRAGVRRLLHVLREHRGYDLTEAVAALSVPVLVVRGRDDPLSTPGWAGGLGTYVEVPGPHTFCWRDPGAWTAPIHSFAQRSARAGQ